MKSEQRMPIVETEEAIEAAFSMIHELMSDDETARQLNGATIAPLEKLVTIEAVHGSERHSVQYAFEVFAGEPNGLPEMARKLVNA